MAEAGECSIHRWLPGRAALALAGSARASGGGTAADQVFVSSTFRDMQLEREELIKRVFPQIRRRCEARGVGWSEVDLRWGVTDEQKAEGAVLPICLAEIDRSRPYFIGLLGQRYGWVPDELPAELAEQMGWLKEAADRSVTELEILHGVLNDPESAGHAFFYVRDPRWVDALTDDERELYTEPEPDGLSKLEELKARLRSSTHPVREYGDPVALGELVLADLTALVDSVYPEEDAPDPLTGIAYVGANDEASDWTALARRTIGELVRAHQLDALDPEALPEDAAGLRAALARAIDQAGATGWLPATLPSSVRERGRGTCLRQRGVLQPQRLPPPGRHAVDQRQAQRSRLAARGPRVRSRHDDAAAELPEAQDHQMRRPSPANGGWVASNARAARSWRWKKPTRTPDSAPRSPPPQQLAQLGVLELHGTAQRRPPGGTVRVPQGLRDGDIGRVLPAGDHDMAGNPQAQHGQHLRFRRIGDERGDAPPAQRRDAWRGRILVDRDDGAAFVGHRIRDAAPRRAQSEDDGVPGEEPEAHRANSSRKTTLTVWATVLAATSGAMKRASSSRQFRSLSSP